MTPTPIMTVSGIRGIVGESITPQFCARMAFAQTKLCGGGVMTVARDTRPSGSQLSRAVAAGIHAAGGTAVDIGIVPTPTACVAAPDLGARGGMILTASHNPREYNGYKMVHRSGRLFTGKECDEVYAAFKSESTPRELTDTQYAFDRTADVTDIHIARILAVVDAAAVRNARIRIAVDSINGAAAAVFPKLLDKLGVAWIGINNKLDGDFVHNPEPRPENLAGLAALLAANTGLWGGFAYDPDADRLMTMGEHGEPISEEMTLAFSLQNVLAADRTDVATNLSTSMVIDDVARSFGVKVFRTKIGEANVVEGMAAHGCRIGGEGNGGVVYPRISTVRDGLAALALVLELMAKTRRTLIQLAGQWPVYSIIKRQVPCAGRDPGGIIRRLTSAFEHEKIDTQDGLKIMRDNGWVHIRPSNTEPILRCYAEGRSASDADSLVKLVMDAL